MRHSVSPLTARVPVLISPPVRSRARRTQDTLKRRPLPHKSKRCPPPPNKIKRRSIAPHQSAFKRCSDPPHTIKRCPPPPHKIKLSATQAQASLQPCTCAARTCPSLEHTSPCTQDRRNRSHGTTTTCECVYACVRVCVCVCVSVCV